MIHFLARKKLILNILIVPVSVIIGTLLMILLYSLPTTQMKESVSKSSSMYEGGAYSFNNWANGKNYAAISNFTDTIMLNTAIFRPTNSVVENAMITAHAIYSEAENVTDAARIANGEEGYSAIEYSRYWHGYLLYMIPVLQLMDVGELKVIGMFLQLFLMLTLVYLLGKRSSLLMLLYGIVALFINPVTTVLTFQEADIYCLMMISMIIILRYNEILKNGWYFSFFMINGVCVAFFDFLTYPLVALGVPLILSLLLDEFGGIIEGIKEITKYSMGWIIGYVGMWGGKWIVGSILTGRDMFSDAFSSIGIRTHGQGEYKGVLSYGNTMQTIWNSINDIPMLILLILTIAIIAIYLTRNKCKVSLGLVEVSRSVCFMIVGLFPFAWYFVAMNHSVIHPWMSYRELAITIWAIAAIAHTFLRPQKDRLNNG